MSKEKQIEEMMKNLRIEQIKGTDNTDCLLVDGRYQIYLDNGCIYDTEGAGDIPQYVFDIRDRAIHKFTDEEVIKALEVCVDNSSCKECPINPNHGNYGYCTNLALTYALDLIKRQKAEIELLKEATTNTINTSIEFGLDKEGQIKKAKVEAVKEFAERLCADRVSNDPVVIAATCMLKEMTGEAYTLDSRSQDVNIESLRHLSASERNVYLMGDWKKDGND